MIINSNYIFWPPIIFFPTQRKVNPRTIKIKSNSVLSDEIKIKTIDIRRLRSKIDFNLKKRLDLYFSISFIMRFRQGDKVEILDKKEVPVSWRIAEILSGNGRNYQVQYNPYPGMASEQLVETISSKLVRPCPPLVQGVENFVAGDIVEVFYEFSWKICTVLEILGGKKGNKSNKIHLCVAAFQNRYLVRLLGCSQELIIDQSNIRMRQTWHGDRWILMRKSSRGGEDVIVSKPFTSNYYKKMNFQVPQCNGRAKYQPEKVCVNNQNDEALRVSPVISSRSLKRMSPYGTPIDEARGCAQKLRAIQKDVADQRLFATPVLEKVDAVAYPRDFLGEKNMHASFNTISNGYNQMERGKYNDVLDCSGIRSSELNDSDSDACSVGSCSITNQCASNCYSHLIPLPCKDTDTLCSDAESCYCSSSKRKSYSLHPKELEVSIRRLELHAYRRTLEALYASGPLSWEQEALLTNLRIMLHISNDEHLMELKHLIPAKTAIII